MPAKFQTKIKKVRFVHTPFTGQQMAEFGQGLLDHIWDRISAGQNTDEAAAKPLADGYAKWKQRKFGNQIRNLQASGRLRRATKVLEANQNKAVIGATPGLHTTGKLMGNMRFRSAITFSGVLTVNNRRERQWGVSNSDRAYAVGLIMGRKPIRAERVA